MSAATRVYAVRMSVNLVEKIDTYAARRARNDGRPCSRSDALRLLIQKGLALEMKVKRGLDMDTPAKSKTIRGRITDKFEPPQPLEEREADEPRRGLWALAPEPKKAKTKKKTKWKAKWPGV